ncbi:MAG: DUF2203 domain-containing protein [Phycisphaerales bacterium]|nr:MAG: DUF2203 domain-containing protein [Phycisphaerales bacterium]
MRESNTGVPRPARTQAPQKLFSVEQANRTLPLVRRILRDVVTQYRLVERIQKRRRKLACQGRLDELKSVEDRGLEAARRLSDLLTELSSIGCEVKDYERGCVDFPAMCDSREIYLCWRLNEERVSHWHERHVGEAGRRALPF